MNDLYDMGITKTGHKKKLHAKIKIVNRNKNASPQNIEYHQGSTAYI